MLRILKKPASGPPTILKLEGKLLEAWVDELRQSANTAAQHGSSVMLDLSGLTFADAAGVATLRELIQQGATIGACSGYIAALLQMEQS